MAGMEEILLNGPPRLHTRRRRRTDTRTRARAQVQRIGRGSCGTVWEGRWLCAR
jgi:hypothetical protein